MFNGDDVKDKCQNNSIELNMFMNSLRYISSSIKILKLYLSFFHEVGVFSLDIVSQKGDLSIFLSGIESLPPKQLQTCSSLRITRI